MSGVIDALYASILSIGLLVGFIRLKRAGPFRPYLALGLSLFMALLFVAQSRDPALLQTFQRDAPRVFTGEWWRLATALFFQDGGLAGAIFNIGTLVFIGSLSEANLGRALWLTAYVVGGLLAEGVALFWQPVGAGNSVAVFSLTGALFVQAILCRPTPLARGLAGVGMAGGLPLLFWRDIHGAALLIGAFLALVWLARPDATAAANAD